MLEKVFGKKSTAVVYIVCSAFLLLSFGISALSYFLWHKGSLLTLVGFAAFTAFELALMSLPVFVQKKFRLYIPPAVEIGICISSAVFLLNRMYSAKTLLFISLSPLVGGFTVAMTVFCILSSLAEARKEHTGRKYSPTVVTAMAFVLSLLLILLLNTGLYLLAFFTRAMPQRGFSFFITYAVSHTGGIAAFCIIGRLSLRSGKPPKYRIQSFKNIENAERSALQNQNTTQYDVIRNISKDNTDYKKVVRWLKTKFLFGRVLYLVLYAGYLVVACITFTKHGKLGLLLIPPFALGFILISLVYIYEYYLFRKGSPNQRLRKFKIAKTCVRIYTLILLLCASFLSDYTLNEFSALLSNTLIIVNLASLFYNLFGKPKHYPPHEKKHAKEELGGDIPPAAPPDPEIK